LRAIILAAATQKRPVFKFALGHKDSANTTQERPGIWHKKSCSRRQKFSAVQPFDLNPVANRLYVTRNGSIRRGSSRFV
jgi:hypothetical protein